MSITQALLAPFDAALIPTGSEPFARSPAGPSAISWPAVSAMFDNGLYPDVVSFLNGYESQYDLVTEIEAEWIALGGTPGDTFTTGFDSNDRFFLEISSAGLNSNFTLTPGSGHDYFGLGGVVTAVSPNGLVTRATAANPWTRGALDFFDFLSVNQVTLTKTGGGGGSGSFLFPYNKSKVQSLPTLLAPPSATIGPYGGAIACLEQIDNDANDPIYRRIKWGLDNSGKVFTSWPPGVGDFAFQNNEPGRIFRSVLGFTGGESGGPIFVGGRKVMTATYPAPSAIILTRGFTSWNERMIQDTAVVPMLNGDLRGRNHYTATEFTASFSLKGPMGSRDEANWALRRTLPLLTRGAKCTAFMRWGDFRLAKSKAELADGTYDFANSTAPSPFGTNYTSLYSGLEGRRHCRISISSGDTYELNYTPSAPRVVTADISIVLREVP